MNNRSLRGLLRGSLGVLSSAMSHSAGATRRAGEARSGCSRAACPAGETPLYVRRARHGIIASGSADLANVSLNPLVC